MTEVARTCPFCGTTTTMAMCPTCASYLEKQLARAQESASRQYEALNPLMDRLTRVEAAAALMRRALEKFRENELTSLAARTLEQVGNAGQVLLDEIKAHQEARKAAEAERDKLLARVERAERAEQMARSRVTEENHELREWCGRIVRHVWIDWAKEQPNPKPSWLQPWDALTEAEREVDRRIGVALAQFGLSGALLVTEDWQRALLQERQERELLELELKHARASSEMHAEWLDEALELASKMQRRAQEMSEQAQQGWRAAITHMLARRLAVRAIQDLVTAAHLVTRETWFQIRSEGEAKLLLDALEAVRKLGLAPNVPAEGNASDEHAS